jgi:UDP-N-acetylmuramoylalanine--D-glutamate ligase
LGESERELEGTRVAVVGLGTSGQAAARLALEHGGDVYVSDVRDDSEVAARGGELAALGARVDLGRHDVEAIATSPTVVVSPGIPPDSPVLVALRDRGVRWISEPEFAFRFFSSALIAVTGTNGKTTTAALTAHLLEAAGITVGLGGNIGAGLGPPASALALRGHAPDWLVVEVSSFQLADIVAFAPEIGVLTNLAPDHLDRYPSVDAYYRDKARLFDNATERSRWILPLGSPAVDSLVGEAPGRRYYFGATSHGLAGGYLRDGILTLRVEESEEPLIPRAELRLLGDHNVANALAASVAARLAGGSPPELREGLRSFEPLPHRLEPVADRDGVLWVNDSKATNVSAACSAVSSLQRPLVLLLGGHDKGEDLAPLAVAARRGVHVAVAFGEASGRIAEALASSVRVIRVGGGLDHAVRVGRREARRNDVLLLAPACSSFDEFHNYEERGDRFRALAQGDD